MGGVAASEPVVAVGTLTRTGPRRHFVPLTENEAEVGHRLAAPAAGGHCARCGGPADPLGRYWWYAWVLGQCGGC